jgi:hypothetical protein
LPVSCISLLFITPVFPGLFSWGWIILYCPRHPTELPEGIGFAIPLILLRSKQLVTLLKISSKRWQKCHVTMLQELAGIA